MMAMLTCRQVTQLVSQGLDRNLAPRERATMLLHFAVCAGCRNVNRQMAFLRRAVRRLGEAQDRN